MDTASLPWHEGIVEHRSKRQLDSQLSHLEPEARIKRNRLDALQSRPNGSTGKSSSVRSNDSGVGRSEDPSGRQERTSPESEPTHGSFTGEARRFACPFHIHNPQKYNSSSGRQYRTCSGPGWLAFKDIKEHIIRRHKAPIHCERCFAEFSTETAKLEHLRQAAPCETKEPRSLEGVTAKQSYRITREPRRCSTEPDKWRKMYEILFPEDEFVPSPYYEDADNTNESLAIEYTTLSKFLEDDLGTIVSRSLEEVCQDCNIGGRNERTELADPVNYDTLRRTLTIRLKKNLGECFRRSLKNVNLS